ncbi:MAG: DUF2520 domain-containing protein [Cyclobacteriaceae bacterium]|nr:DUF2520 domain-containing protein [Cyclobacteriaceae bacterium]
MAAQIFLSFIGSGNLAWHLAPALDNAGFVVKEVYSPNPNHAGALTERLYQAEVKATLDFSTSDSSIFILAVRDEAIAQVAREIILPDDAILIHTSGSVPITELQYAATPHVGVLYALQTFSKERKADFSNVPLFVETLTGEATAVVLALAKGLSKQVHRITSEERKALHVAAVFASNFTNHMLMLSQKIMQQNSLDYSWLKPLITETLQKSLAIGPKYAQTGPAKRGDLEILDNHVQFLNDDERMAEVYRVISQHIIDTYHAE